MKKKLHLKQSVKDLLGRIAIISMFYLVIIVEIIALNARMEQLNQQKMTESVAMNQSK